MAFLKDAIKHYTVDLPNRMKEIKASLDTVTQQVRDPRPGGPATPGPAPVPRAPEPAHRVNPRPGTSPTPAQNDLDVPDGQVDAVLSSLEELMDIVENLDFATDFNSVGGMPVLLRLLGSRHAAVRGAAAEVLATSVQNHPQAQAFAVAQGCLPALSALLSAEGQDAGALAKGLFACGSLVRGNEAAMAALREAVGVRRVAALAGHGDARVRRKALQLMAALARESAGCRADVVAAGAVGALVGALGEEDMGVVHVALESLFALAKDPASRGSVQGSAAVAGAVAALLGRLEGMSAEDRDAYREQSVLAKLLSRVAGGAGS